MRINTAIEYKITCPYCGSIITFKLDEVKRDPSSLLSDIKGFQCPHCNVHITTHFNGQLCARVKPVYENEIEIKCLINIKEPEESEAECLKKLFEKENE